MMGKNIYNIKNIFIVVISAFLIIIIINIYGFFNKMAQINIHKDELFRVIYKQNFKEESLNFRENFCQNNKSINLNIPFITNNETVNDAILYNIAQWKIQKMISEFSKLSLNFKQVRMPIQNIL